MYKRLHDGYDCCISVFLCLAWNSLVHTAYLPVLFSKNIGLASYSYILPNHPSSLVVLPSLLTITASESVIVLVLLISIDFVILLHPTACSFLHCSGLHTKHVLTAVPHMHLMFAKKIAFL